LTNVFTIKKMLNWSQLLTLTLARKSLKQHMTLLSHLNTSHALLISLGGSMKSALLLGAAAAVAFHFDVFFFAHS
jgi:hypothetical protein